MAAGLRITASAVLRITAALEVPTALALILAPSLPVAILFGAGLETAPGLLVARFAGVPLLSLGMACWRAGSDRKGRAASVLLTAMSLYDVLAAALLAYASLVLGPTGIGLWPAVVETPAHEQAAAPRARRGVQDDPAPRCVSVIQEFR